MPEEAEPQALVLVCASDDARDVRHCGRKELSVRSKVMFGFSMPLETLGSGGSSQGDPFWPRSHVLQLSFQGTLETEVIHPLPGDSAGQARSRPCSPWVCNMLWNIWVTGTVDQSNEQALHIPVSQASNMVQKWRWLPTFYG